MEQIVVYTLNGNVRSSLRNRAGGCAFVSADIEENLMSSEVVRVSVESLSSIGFTVGDYIVIDGMKYRMNQAPQVVRDGREIFVYSLVFESAKYDLVNCMFLLPDTSDGDYQTATLAELAQMIVDNANRVYAGEWVLGTCPDETDVITEQYTERNCLVALQSICEAYELQFRITESNNVKTIDIFKNGSNTSLYLEYGRAKGLYDITREATSSEEIITRLYAYGSADNLPTGYPHTRLCLPYTGEDADVCRRNVSYIQDDAKVAQFGLKEGIAIFEDEKPHCKSKITAIEEGNVLKFSDNEINFDILAYWQEDEFLEFCERRGYDENDATVQQLFTESIVGQERKYIVDGHATITFNTGNLAGYSFQLEDYDASTHMFAINPIIVNEGDELLEQQIPDPDNAAFQFAEGDIYVISDIVLPSQFVSSAETSLKEAATTHYNEHSKVCARYRIDFDRIYLLRNYSNGLRILCGNNIHLKDAQLGIDSWIKVTRYYRNLLTDEVTVDISDIKKRNPNSISARSRGTSDEAVVDNFGNVIHDETTTLTCVFTPNHNETTGTFNANAVSISAGLFSNYSLAKEKRVWRLYDRVKTDFSPKYEYNVFVRASKRTQEATIFFEPVLRSMTTGETSVQREDVNLLTRRSNPSLSDRNSNFYYFKIGTLSKAAARYLSQRAARTLALEYGDVNIPANSVVGGDMHIVDVDGNVVLDSAQRSAYLDTLSVLADAEDESSRINVGYQAGRVPSMVEDIATLDSEKADAATTPTLTEVNERFANIATIRTLLNTIYNEMTEWNERIGTWTANMQSVYSRTPDFPKSKTVCPHATAEQQSCSVLPDVSEITRNS